MIDLHSHILPDFDDGARNLEDAVAMARMALAGGVTVMAATPHGRRVVSTSSRYSVGLVHERLSVLRTALAAAGVALELVAGTDYAEPGALERLRAGELLPYGTTRSVLVELPFALSLEAAEQLLFAMQLGGYRVVLAHPERYSFVQRDPNTLIGLIERGVLMQLTGDALLGHQGPRMRRMAELLLRHGIIQILATDAHGPHFGRMPNLAEARDQAAQLVGVAQAQALTETTPAAVLADRPVTPPTPEPVKRWFGLW